MAISTWRVANFGANAVSILLGKGDGTFQNRMDYGAAQPRSVAWGDFNHDGRADLVFANQNPSTVSVLLDLPVLALFPNTLTFGNQTVGTTGPAETFLLSNPSALPLTISKIFASGDFAQANTCPFAPASLPAGANCTVRVTFSPSVTGTRTGLITITDNTTTSPQTIALTGVGGLSPVASLYAAALDFGYHVVGTPSLPQAVTLTNTGGGTLNISSLAPSSGFVATSNCGTSLAPNASCTVTVTFDPTAVGPVSGTVTITDNAVTASQTISLSGIGAPTPTYVFPSTLDFGSQQLGLPSPAQTVTLANASNQPLLIRKILASPHQYAQTNKCGASLVPGASCSIEVNFTPSTTGVQHGFLTILDNGDPKFAIVKLTGDGI